MLLSNPVSVTAWELTNEYLSEFAWPHTRMPCSGRPFKFGSSWCDCAPIPLTSDGNPCFNRIHARVWGLLRLLSGFVRLRRDRRHLGRRGSFAFDCQDKWHTIGHDRPEKKPIRCQALTGQVGHLTRCVIYDRRSTTCRAFLSAWENGVVNSNCDRARASYGLMPISNF